jgi:hypothetical protein
MAFGANPSMGLTVSVGQPGDRLECLLPFVCVHRLLFFTQIAIVVFVLVGIVIAATKL